jgi:hypothetical protein
MSDNWWILEELTAGVCLTLLILSSVKEAGVVPSPLASFYDVASVIPLGVIKKLPEVSGLI